MPVTLPRSRGCLLGLAIGDALGAPVEFCRPGSFEPVTGYRPGGAFDLEAGQWTDDSSMALCLGDSRLVTGELDLADQLERYWRRFEQGENSVTGRCFDIGVPSLSSRSPMDPGVLPRSWPAATPLAPWRRRCNGGPVHGHLDRG